MTRREAQEIAPGWVVRAQAQKWIGEVLEVDQEGKRLHIERLDNGKKKWYTMRHKSQWAVVGGREYFNELLKASEALVDAYGDRVCEDYPQFRPGCRCPGCCAVKRVEDVLDEIATA